MAPYHVGMGFPTTVLAVNSVGLTLSFFAITLRFWARMHRHAKLRLSDYTIVASWLFTLGLVISENFCVIKGGVGQNTMTVTMDQLMFTTKQFVVIGVTGVVAITLVKVSILDLFISLFSANNQFKIVAYAFMGITISYGVSFTVATLASCTPFEANWDKISHPDYKCINTSRFYVAQCAIGAALDCMILLLPLPVVWGLKMKTNKKIALTFLFSLGILVCATSIARLVYNTRQTYMLTHFTEYAGIAALLGALEANLSIICACLPPMQPLLTALSDKVKSTFSSNRTSLKSLLNPFSSRSRKPTRGSVKLSSTGRKSGLSNQTDEDLESARLRNQHDKLYPLSMATTTRVSVDGNDSNGDEHMEMERLGRNPELYSNISVTKSWQVS